MGENSLIGWCHHTLNIVEGCVKVSEECDFCYAETRDSAGMMASTGGREDLESR